MDLILLKIPDEQAHRLASLSMTVVNSFFIYDYSLYHLAIHNLFSRMVLPMEGPNVPRHNEQSFRISHFSMSPVLPLLPSWIFSVTQLYQVPQPVSCSCNIHKILQLNIPILIRGHLFQPLQLQSDLFAGYQEPIFNRPGASMKYVIDMYYIFPVYTNVGICYTI